MSNYRTPQTIIQISKINGKFYSVVTTSTGTIAHKQISLAHAQTIARTAARLGYTNIGENTLGNLQTLTFVKF